MGDYYCGANFGYHPFGVCRWKPVVESKMVYKCSERKPTLPFELPMLFGDDLNMDKGLTFVL